MSSYSIFWLLCYICFSLSLYLSFFQSKFQFNLILVYFAFCIFHFYFLLFSFLSPFSYTPTPSLVVLLFLVISLGPPFNMANSFKNWFSLLGTYNTIPQKPPPSKVNPVGTDTLNNSEFLLSKTYFKLLQSIHHTEILSEALRTGVPPLGMARKVAYLTAFIKPAAPDEIVLSEIKNNTIWTIT